jgi:hypothetical protein
MWEFDRIQPTRPLIYDSNWDQRDAIEVLPQGVLLNLTQPGTKEEYFEALYS